MTAYNKIYDFNTNRFVNLYSQRGGRILNSYLLNNLIGGSEAVPMDIDEEDAPVPMDIDGEDAAAPVAGAAPAAAPAAVPVAGAAPAAVPVAAAARAAPAAAPAAGAAQVAVATNSPYNNRYFYTRAYNVVYRGAPFRFEPGIHPAGSPEEIIMFRLYAAINRLKVQRALDNGVGVFNTRDELPYEGDLEEAQFPYPINGQAQPADDVAIQIIRRWNELHP